MTTAHRERRNDGPKTWLVATGLVLLVFIVLVGGVVTRWFDTGARIRAPDSSESRKTDAQGDVSRQSKGLSMGPTDAAASIDSAAAPLLAGASKVASQHERIDLRLDKWDTEVFSENANAQLKALAKLLAHPDEMSIDQLSPLATPGFRASDLLPRQLQTVFRDPSIAVERGWGDQVQPHGEVAGFFHAARTLTAALRGARDVHCKFKLFNVEPDGDTVLTRQYVALSGRTAEGMLEQNATWRIRWQQGEAEAPPRLLAIQLESFEQTTYAGDAGPLFSDCTESVFDRVEAFDNHLCHGIDYWNERIERRMDMNYFGQHGLALGDVNGDGRDDVYLCQAGGLPNLLLIHQPDGTVLDTSTLAGVDVLDMSLGALLVDLDNDGDQDLAVSTTRQLALLANDGQGRFMLAAHLRGVRGGYSLAAADYDNDADLDLYVCVYYRQVRDFGSLAYPIPYHDANNGGANVLLRNNGDWQFQDATADVGLDEDNRRFSFSAVWEDYDNDGDQDLYVANDFGRNCLYQNSGGRFRNVAAAAGVEDTAFGMSVDSADFDRNGFMDFYLGNMFSGAGNRIAFQPRFQQHASQDTKAKLQRTARGNSLYANRGDGAFRDASVYAGVTMGRWSWGSIFLDVNNDGWQDLAVLNGFVTGDVTDDL